MSLGTRTWLGKWHYTDGSAVFNYETGTTIIEGADPGSFVVLKDRYARDANAAYFQCERIAGAHGATFEALGHGYAKDQQHIYFDGLPLTGASPERFTLRKWFLLTQTSVFHAGDPIEADPVSFELLTPPFAKDRASVFVHGAARTTYGACHADCLRVEGAHAATFQALGKKYAWFAKDRRDAYTAVFTGGTRRGPYPAWRIVMLESANVASFRLLDEEKQLAADDSNVWFKELRLPGADVSSFRTDLPMLFARDDTHVYYGAEPIIGADVARFEVFPESCWARDGRTVFYMFNTMKGVDYDSFQVLDWNEARDRDHVYYLGETLRKARSTDKIRKAYSQRLAKAGKMKR
jgi:hypothetical protein